MQEQDFKLTKEQERQLAKLLKKDRILSLEDVSDNKELFSLYVDVKMYRLIVTKLLEKHKNTPLESEIDSLYNSIIQSPERIFSFLKSFMINKKVLKILRKTDRI